MTKIEKQVNLTKDEAGNDREIQVGDVMIYVHSHGNGPVRLNVARTTKKQFRLTLPDGKESVAFKKDGWKQYIDVDDEGVEHSWHDEEDDAEVTRYHYASHEEHGQSSYGRSRAHAYTDHPVVFAMLQRTHEHLVEQAKEKQAKRDQERVAREQREAAEMAETKAAFGGSLLSRTRMQQTNPDGSRMYVINVPVKPEHAEQKKGWETMIVCCRTIDRNEKPGREENEKVEASYTYQNGGQSSFSSVSTYRTETDEEAIWYAVDHEYHRAW